MLFLAAFVAPALEALLGRGPPAVARAPLHGLAPPRASAPPHLFATTADSLTFEAASLCASSAGPGTFESPDALEDALRRHGVDTSRWDTHTVYLIWYAMWGDQSDRSEIWPCPW